MITMKFRNWIVFGVLLGTLCFSTLVMAVPPIKVELKVAVVGGVSELQVADNSKPCDGVTATSPCIVVANKKSPFIIFTLPKACDGGATDPVYELTGMRITQIEKVWPTSGDPLDEKVAKDFKADPNTGEIDFHYGKNKKTNKKLKFKDRNKHAYSVFYEISASPCDDASDDDDIYLDPEIRNKGNN